MTQIIITGAGPAGVVAAILLQRAGLTVTLIGAPRRFSALEGLAERAHRALTSLRCTNALSCAGNPVARVAHWGDQTFTGNREFLIDRASFDEALIRDAIDNGVNFLNARVRAVTDHENYWRFSLPKCDEIASYWLDARGRTAPRSKERVRAPATIAIARWWQGKPDEAQAGVSPFSTGWSWYARQANGKTCVQFFVNAREVSGRAGLEDIYQACLALCPAAAQMTKDALPVGTVFTRAAELTYNKPIMNARYARIGDAALAIDPLAGHGIFEAIGSAMAAAPAIRTLLENPDDTALATQFYEHRMDADFNSQARSSRDFYSLETRWADQAFWSTRKSWPDQEPSHPQAPPDTASIATRPVLINGYVVAREVIIAADHPRGVWQVSGVPLIELLRIIAAPVTGNERSPEELTRRCPWPAGQTLTALRWLDERGLLSLASQAISTGTTPQ